MEKRGALQISFGWLFAIIVGAFILFLAIYGVTKLIGQEQEVVGAKTSKEIGILLNPLETSFETGRTSSFTLPAETRIYNRCDETDGFFGKQGIQVSQKSFDKWTETEVNVPFSNKYIFSKEYAEGKTFYLFSKPFVFPFKIADVVYLTSSLDIYCFDKAPEEIEEELTDLNQKNLFPNCTKVDDKAIKVCFGSGNNCDIDVNIGLGYVEKRGQKLYFETNALMYAAIFSEKKGYECQIKRLMKRLSQLASLYNNKKLLISDTGCGSGLDLDSLIKSASELDSSNNLGSMYNYIVKDIQESNERAGECKLW